MLTIQKSGFFGLVLLLSINLLYAKDIKNSETISLPAENGYDLWLRYVKVQDETLLAKYHNGLTQIVVADNSPTANATRDELRRGLSGLLGRDVPVVKSATLDGAVVVSVPSLTSADVAAVKGDGYRIFTKKMNGKNVTVISAKTSVGNLYGAFALLRLIQTNQPINQLDIVSNPSTQYRMLNHWDGLGPHGTYFGRSINLSKWNELPGKLDQRYTDYARANASIGVNGTVINNFGQGLIRSDDIKKIAALAKIYRVYGIRIYLSINFASPLKPVPGKNNGGIGDLNTADPRDPRVAKWWKDKADEIYSLIPDFGGFLVKADSEGMAGPKQYGRDHAEAANMLAAALAPHGGLLMWRAFVYDTDVDPDRAKRSYKDFKPLDGKFASNVIVQVKNGPLDFQPREPFHPLWGSMPKTPMFMEFEIKQEYLGRVTDLVYLGEEWADILQSETFAKGKGSTVAKIVDGSLEGYKNTGMAGVANMGDDSNWCSHPFAQANWYAFGRLAWNVDMKADDIANEWAKMTWGNDPAVVKTVTAMMKGSWQAAIDVRSPLGLNFVCAGDHHNPHPSGRVNDYWFADKNGVGYNRTDHPEDFWKETGSNSDPMGFNRTDKLPDHWKDSGSGAVTQYNGPLRTTFNDMSKCPEELLLYFHFVPWDHKMKSGRNLWEELCYKYNSGYEYARTLQNEWKLLEGKIDEERFALVTAKLAEQEAHHKKWRDTCLDFFVETSGRPIPASSRN